MRRALMAGAVFALAAAAQTAGAADLPRAPIAQLPAVVAPPFNWSGCYVGGHLGGVWGQSDVHFPLIGPEGDINIKSESVAGGAQVGCDYQAPGSPWVFGLEGDWSWLDLDGDAATGGPAGERYRTKWDWTASARVRLGVAPANTLYYVTGGAAWAHLDVAQFFNNIPTSSVPQSGTQSGWTAGAGIEHAFSPNWVLGLEYLYSKYDSDRYICPGCGPADVDLKTHTVRARLNYKFATGKTPPPPVVTKY